MSEGRTPAGAAARVGSGAGRLVRAWRTMPHERRIAAYASLGLFLTLFLPWYQRQFFVVIGGKLQPASDSQTAWGAFSFVEAAVLLVAGSVLTLLFQRAEGKAFHLPGGDGLAVTIAGFWACALIVWRIFDKQGGQANGQNATTYGIEWGIFIALAVAALLAYAGSRIRAAHQPEPPLPGEDDPPRGGWASPQGPGPVAPEGRARSPERPGASERAREEAPAVSGERPAPAPKRPRMSSERRPTSSEGRATSSERRAGWLTAPPSQMEQSNAAPEPTDWPAAEWRAPQDGRGRRAPKPVAADDSPTIRAIRRPGAPLPPSTAAAQRDNQPDDQLTIPLERED